MRVFRSIYHPGDSSLALALARAQAGPIAFAFVGVMVVTLAAVLQGADVLTTLLWAVPLAYACAAAWGVYDLQRRPAEIVLRHGFGAIRSAWDVARSREAASPFSVRLEPVFEPGRKEGLRFAAIGDRVLPLRPGEWPEYDRLLGALREAATELEGMAEA